ncbi:MAG TPA: hypothetical protein PLN48_13485 [Lachnospiraceae bacterium]|nr:hypothetical protein [Lachnospiraceae bacterium]
MSYDLDHVTASCPCPCGKGEIVYGSGTNDWNQTRDGMMEIWCSDCCKKYKFSKNGLLPVDFPDYQGDPIIKDKMDKLQYRISNYDGTTPERISQYLSEEECEKYKARDFSIASTLRDSKKLADDYSLEELQEAAEKISAAKYSTQLTGIALELAQRHKRWNKTIRLQNVIVPILMAIRNYALYKKADKEDGQDKAKLQKQLDEYKAEYYKDYDAYEKKRLQNLIPFELKERSR